jgi:gluconolactonase
MRWLWKDWPQPVTAGESQNAFLKGGRLPGKSSGILLPGEGWQPVSGDYESTGALANDLKGEIVFRDSTGGKTWKIGADGQIREYAVIRGGYESLAFGPDDRVYITDTAHAKIVAYTNDGRPSVIARGIRGLDLIVTYRSAVYVTESRIGDDTSGKVWLIKPNGEKTLLDSGLNQPSGIALSPDGMWLAVAENRTHWGYSYRVAPDGTVQDKQRFYRFEVPDQADDSAAEAWTMDNEGRLYAATRLGVQVFDRFGRVRAILPVPGGKVIGLAFGGSNFDTLYVSCADHKLYRRKLGCRAAPAWAAPVE